MTKPDAQIVFKCGFLAGQADAVQGAKFKLPSFRHHPAIRAGYRAGFDNSSPSRTPHYLPFFTDWYNPTSPRKRNAP